MAPPVPSSTDGRPSMHEWIVAADGRLVKTDAGGHTEDHTIVGLQSLAWDVAGLIVEWRLDAAETRQLLRTLRAERVVFPGGTLRRHLVAWAAFRAGWCRLAIDSLSDPAEIGRFELAFERYRDLVEALVRVNRHESERSPALHL
jgi:hypothetical protein